MQFETILTMTSGLLLMAACSGQTDSPSPAATPPLAGTGGQTQVPDPTPISAKATVKRKTGARMAGDLAQALELDAGELCRELGEQNCADVHAIALGGVSAETAGVFEPLETSTATSPIAVDRLVLSACQTRAWRDLEGDDAAVLFGNLPLSDGRLDPEAPEVGAAIADLYHRAHLREPKASEAQHLRELYRQIEAAGSSSPARDWAALSCYAVFTTVEAVFY